MAIQYSKQARMPDKGDAHAQDPDGTADRQSTWCGPDGERYSGSDIDWAPRGGEVVHGFMETDTSGRGEW